MNAKKRILISLSLILVVLALSGCNLFLKPNGDLTGTVVDGDSVPLVAAKIYAGDKLIGYSNTEGEFAISLKPGKYEIYADYHGKTSAKQTIDVKTEGAEVDFKVDIKPAFMDDFSGTALDTNKWTESIAWTYNKWAATEKGALVADGSLHRPWVAGKSTGIKAKDLEIVDAAVEIRIKDTGERGASNTGLRVHLRNNEEVWADGYGVNASAVGLEFATWNFVELDATKAENQSKKTNVHNPGPAQVTTDWSTWLIVVKDHTVEFYRNGEFVASSTEKDPDAMHEKGGLFLEFNGSLLIDYVKVYQL